MGCHRKMEGKVDKIIGVWISDDNISKTKNIFKYFNDPPFDFEL